MFRRDVSLPSRAVLTRSQGWIVSAYFLTQTAFLLMYGQILTLADRKWTYLAAIAIFELGSLICAVANSVEVLIFGRAFAGVGAAGIFVSVLSIIAEVTRLEDRPKLLGASALGPLCPGNPLCSRADFLAITHRPVRRSVRCLVRCRTARALRSGCRVSGSVQR